MTVVDFVPDQVKHMVLEHWYNFAPVNPMWHYLLGVIYLVLGFTSIAGNGLVIYLYMKSQVRYYAADANDRFLILKEILRIEE